MLFQLSRPTEQRDFATSRKSFEDALSIRRNSLPKDHPGVGRSLRNLGMVSCVSGNGIREAVPDLSRAVDLFLADQLRRAAIQGETEQFAEDGSRSALRLFLTAALTSNAQPDSIYDTVVRAKGAVTAQQRLARQLRESADPETVRLLTRLREVTQQLASLSRALQPGNKPNDPGAVATTIRSLATERTDLERQLGERSAVYRSSQAQGRIGADEVRAALPKGTALIDFVEYAHVTTSLEYRMVAFVVLPDRKTVVVPLGDSKPLAELIERWRASYGSGKLPSRDEADPATELRKKLWEPVAKHVEGVKVVLVSPDGAVNGLPLAALPGAKAGTYLIHDHGFVTVPIPKLIPELLRERPGEPAKPVSLVVGNVDFDAITGPGTKTERTNRFAPLPGTNAEATAVHDLFRTAFADRQAVLLTGTKATKAAFVGRAPNCTHLLVATHGFFLPRAGQERPARSDVLLSAEVLSVLEDVVTANPALRSGLVFSGANHSPLGTGDSFLTALEAAELDLRRVDLAVLSACETGLGKNQEGEGMLGLQRAFQVAGVRTTVTSLWKVPDTATQALMTRFHSNLWEKKRDTPLGKLEALREAQLWLIREGATNRDLLRSGLTLPEPKAKDGDAVSPYFWAAFVLSGDWR